MKSLAKAQPLKRCTKRSDYYKQNKTFNEDCNKFYRSLNDENAQVEEPPSKQDVEQFWRNILEAEKEHNNKALWIKDEDRTYRHTQPDK